MSFRRLVTSPLAWLGIGVVFVGCLAVVIFSYVALREERLPVASLPAEVESNYRADRFPVSVDPLSKVITDDPYVDTYLYQFLSLDPSTVRKRRLFARTQSSFSLFSFVQQLASPQMRTLVIYPGERREEIVSEIGDILRWSGQQEKTFSTLITDELPVLQEGKFHPGRYLVDRKATPETVAKEILNTFSREVLERYDETVSGKVPLEQALTIASLLEREAYDFTDMRVISGVIWNRLFIDMPLQLDATLQYARGSLPSESLWWPRVRPSDKFINSPFNTYKETGLPPAPIANPSVEAIVAALNPRKTDCLFYFHGRDGKFYCTETYEKHVAKLREIYGRGR